MSAAPQDTAATVASIARQLVARDVDHERIAHACGIAPSLPHDQRTAAVLSTVAFLARSRDEWASRALTTRSFLDGLAASLALGVDMEQTSDADLFARILDELRARDARYRDALVTVEALTRRAEQAEAARTALAFAVEWTPATLAGLTAAACTMYLRARGWTPRSIAHAPSFTRWTLAHGANSYGVDVDSHRRVAPLRPGDIEIIAATEGRCTALVVADLLALSAERASNDAPAPIAETCPDCDADDLFSAQSAVMGMSSNRLCEKHPQGPRR